MKRKEINKLRIFITKTVYALGVIPNQARFW